MIPKTMPSSLRALAATTLLSLTGTLTAQDATKPSRSPVEVIRATTEEITKVLENRELPELTQQNQVMDVIDRQVDFETVCKLVLARNYKKFSKEQRTKFIHEFRRHLLFTYWNNATTFEFERIDVTGDRKEKRKDWTVKTIVYHNGDSSKVDYRLRLRGDDAENPGEWKIIDIVIEGVSLVSNFRSQFKSMIANDGPDRLLETLRKKNDKAEAAMKAKEEES